MDNDDFEAGMLWQKVVADIKNKTLLGPYVVGIHLKPKENRKSKMPYIKSSIESNIYLPYIFQEAGKQTVKRKKI